MALAPEGPPRSEAELLARARELARYDLGRVADAVGMRPPPDLGQDKGWVGQVLEVALGATASNRAEPDFTQLGVELKSVPVDAHGKPRGSTFITSAPYAELEDAPWTASSVCHKTRRILWIPVEADDAVPLTARRIGQGVLWSPAAEHDARFLRDWGTFREAVRADPASIDARLGDALQLRPKARDGRARTQIERAGRTWSLRPLGVYFRRTFVAEVFEKEYTTG